jgi:hypothetical protein
MELIERLKVVEKEIKRNKLQKPQSLQFLLNKKHEIVDFLNQESQKKQEIHQLEFERLSRELVRKKLDLENIGNVISSIKKEKSKM